MAEEIRRVITIEDKASPALDKLVDTANEAATELNKVDVNIKSFDKTSKAFTDGLDDIAEGFDQIIPGTKQATEGFIKVKNALKLLVANPVILGIGAVVTVVYGLVKAIKNNESAMASLKTAFKAFEPVIDVFNDAIAAVAKGIAVVVEGIGNWITKLTDLIGITSKASREQKALAEPAQKSQEIINSGLTEGITNYRSLIQDFYNLKTGWRELQKSMGTSSYKSNAEAFLNTWKGTFENLSKYSESFKSIASGINSIYDLSDAYKQLNTASSDIQVQMLETTKQLGINAEQTDKLAESLGKLVILQNKANEVNETGLQYNQALGVAKKYQDSEKYGRILIESAKKKYEEYNELNNSFLSSLKSTMTEAFTQAGWAADAIEKEWESASNKYLNAPDLYKWAEAQLQGLVELASAGQSIFDLTDLFTLDVDKIITNSEANADETPVVKVRIEPLESVDSDMLPGNHLDYTGSVSMMPDMSNFKENMLVVLQEQLANLDEYTLEYWDKARQVEDWAWEIEKERLEAEGYTNQQIEALREEHNKRLINLDKQQVLSAVSATEQGLGSLASMFDAFADMTGEDSEAAFEQSKKLQIASATVTMLQGIASAIATGMQLGPIAGPIVGAINAATVLASGMANIVKIKKTTFDNASGSGATVSSSATSSSYNPTYTANTTGLSDIDALQGAVSSGVSAGSNAVKVYVTESDISDAVNKKKVKVTESTF